MGDIFCLCVDHYLGFTELSSLLAACAQNVVCCHLQPLKRTHKHFSPSLYLQSTRPCLLSPCLPLCQNGPFTPPGLWEYFCTWDLCLEKRCPLFSPGTP